MNQSNLTSFSFTVDDDLISQTSVNTTFIKPRPFGSKPFTKDFGPKGAAISYHDYQNTPVPSIQKRIIDQAKNEAYRDLNNQLFNPFEHKLKGGYLSKQADLFQREKQKQIEIIKKKELQQINSAKNYTIVFNNDQSGKSLKLAANNILNQDGRHSISDYYNRKFKMNKGTTLNEIAEENQQFVKNNNYVAPIRKQNSINKLENSKDRNQKNDNVKMQHEKIIKSNDGWKRESQSQKAIQQKYIQQKKTYSPINIPKPKINQVKKQDKTTKKQISTTVKKEIHNNEVKANKASKTQITNKKKNQTDKNQLDTKKKFSEIYEGPDRNLVEQLQKQIVESPKITFDDIAELDNAKNLLQQAVLLPRMMPEFFKGIRKAMKGVLLFGPPGTGKTLLAKAVAYNNMFFNVSASSLASKWKGQSEKMVRLLFQMARYYSPSVIFFDEIDSIATKRSENEHESARKVKTQLLVQMDGVGNSEQSVFVLAATNRPWDLDEALRRRLQKRIYIPLPGKEGRQKMFELNLKQIKMADKINWAKLIELTKGCSGADICNICRDAAYMPMRRKLNQVGGIHKLSQIEQKDLLQQEVTEADLIQSATKIKPSVGNEDLKRYSEWMKQFGSN